MKTQVLEVVTERPESELAKIASWHTAESFARRHH